MTHCQSLICPGLILAAFFAAPVAAQAQDAASRYIKFEIEKCTIIEQDKAAGSVLRHCAGLGDDEVYLAENDLRVFVGFGPDGLRQKAFSQTLAPFNRIHDTIEFRQRPGADAPHAAILRYFTNDAQGEAKGQVLVVTRMAGSQACHMAYIDALANPNPNALAQETADEDAADFDCESGDVRIVGASGKSPM